MITVKRFTPSVVFRFRLVPRATASSFLGTRSAGDGQRRHHSLKMDMREKHRE